MALLEEPGEILHPLSYVGGRQHRLRLLRKEAAHQPHEPDVVVSVANHGDQLPQRRRTPQEQFGQPAQARRGCNWHRSTLARRPVAAA